MDKILEALKKMLPENQINEVADAIKGMLKQAKVDVEKEYNSRLEEAYSELAKELTEAEKTAENGYPKQKKLPKMGTKKHIESSVISVVVLTYKVKNTRAHSKKDTKKHIKCLSQKEKRAEKLKLICMKNTITNSIK